MANTIYKLQGNDWKTKSSCPDIIRKTDRPINWYTINKKSNDPDNLWVTRCVFDFTNIKEVKEYSGMKMDTINNIKGQEVEVSLYEGETAIDVNAEYTIIYKTKSGKRYRSSTYGEFLTPSK